MNFSSDGASRALRGDPRIDDSARRIRVRWAGWVALGAALLVLAAVDVAPFSEIVFDAYQRAAPRAVARFPARIVEIDERSLAAHGRWPWPRFVVARLARSIFERGALAIGFDMVFAEPDRTAATEILKGYATAPPGLREAVMSLPDPDKILAATVSRLPVVLGRAGIADRRGGADPKTIPIAATFSPAPPPRGLISFPGVVTNLPELDAAAAGHAIINGSPDADGIVRRVPLVALVGGRLTPTLSLEVLRVAAKLDGYRLEAQDGALDALTLGEHRVPTDPRGRVRPYFSPPLEARLISAAAILDGSAPADAFRGSVVLVGATALGLGDIVATPVYGETPGVDVHAQLVEAILSGAWLRRPQWGPGIEFSLALILGLAAVLGLPYLRPVAVIGVTCAVLLLLGGASYGAFAGPRILFDPLVPGAVGGLAALVMLCMMFVEADRRRRALRAMLVEERIDAARLAGELQAAREIQIGLLPDRERLRALPRAVEVDAVLEPARSVGGDLYDAFMLDDGRLFFMVGDVTGKGVPAALFMALSKALTHSAMRRGKAGLGAAVLIANEEISRENPSELFVTALLGLLDPASGRVELVNAGHENPLLVGAAGGVREFAMEGGPPLCVLEGYLYPVEPILLAPGDVLLLTTDGVTEARNPDGALFGRGRLIETLAALPRPAGPQDVTAAVLGAVHSFEAGREPNDDLTILAVRYCGP